MSYNYKWYQSLIDVIHGLVRRVNLICVQISRLCSLRLQPATRARSRNRTQWTTPIHHTTDKGHPSTTATAFPVLWPIISPLSTVDSGYMVHVYPGKNWLYSRNDHISEDHITEKWPKFDHITESQCITRDGWQSFNPSPFQYCLGLLVLYPHLSQTNRVPRTYSKFQNFPLWNTVYWPSCPTPPASGGCVL